MVSAHAAWSTNKSINKETRISRFSAYAVAIFTEYTVWAALQTIFNNAFYIAQTEKESSKLLPQIEVC